MPEVTPHLNLLGRWIAACQPLWRAGMQNDPLPDPPIALDEGALNAMRSTPLDALAVFPTHTARPMAEARETLQVFAKQLIDASQALGLRIGLVAGVQYRDPDGVEAALTFARDLFQGLPAGLESQAAFIVRSRIKPDTLNAAHEISKATGARWQLWIDDDVTLAEGAMTALLAAGVEHGDEDLWALGLRRTAIRSDNWLSKIYTLRRRHARKQMHPLGCSMLIPVEAPVWPIARWSDDTWLAARVIDPIDPLPYVRALVVESHDVRFQAPEGLIYSLSRSQRIHTHQIMVLSEVDPYRGQRYFTTAMFGGIFGRGDGLRSAPGIALSIVMQSVGISLWLMRANWIALRGILHWPLKRSPWAIGDRFLKPTS